MKVHVLQHVPFEDIGSMAAWLGKRGARIRYTRFHEGQDLPDVQGIDLVIAMGGPMSANDESEFPWLRDEKRFVRKAVERGVAVLGVCLGAQLIASALGRRVYRNAVKEIGWFPVESTDPGADAFRFPRALTVFHWHGETFDLPEGAVHLARSAACENQAFQVGRKAIGLQFHLETTPESLRALVDNCAADLVPGPYVQSKSQICSVANEAYTGINIQMERVLAFLTRVAG